MLTLMRVWGTVVGVVAIAAVAGGGWYLYSMGTVDVGPPPRLNETDTLDPMVAEAIGQAVRDADESPDDAAARGKLAMVYHAHGMLDEAAAAYQQAIQLDPGNPRWWYHLGRILDRQTKAVAALRCYEKAIERDKTYPVAHNRRGLLLLDQGKIDEASRSFDRALELDGDNAQALLGRARVLMARGEIAQAAGILEQLVQQHPNVPYFRQLLGTAYVQLHREDDARRVLVDISGGQPNWSDQWAEEVDRLRTGYSWLVQAAEQALLRNRPQAALDQLQALGEHHPQDTTTLNYQAQAYLAMGNLQRAEQLLRASLRKDETSYETHINLSLVYERQGDLGKALHHGREAIRLSPRNSHAHLQVGRLHVIGQNYEEARASLQNAAAFGMSGEGNYTMFAGVLSQLGRWSEAADVYRQILEEMNPESVAGLAGLARAEFELGNRELAANLLRQARSIQADHPMLAQVEQHIRQRQQIAPQR